MKDKEVTLLIHFRPLAWGFVAAFFVTLGASGVATFMLTDYTPETDKITKFYNKFNPCIFFDHYPAKVIALLGIGIMILCGQFFSLLLFVFEFSERKIFQVLASAALLFSLSMVQLMFVNVFTVDLYPNGRRLHSAKDTGDLSPSEVSAILLHTSFYIGWVVAEFLLSIHVVRLAWPKLSSTNRISWGCVLAVGWLGAFLHGTSMISAVAFGAFGPAMNAHSIYRQAIQTGGDYLGVANWGWLVFFVYRFCLPARDGVSFTFCLTHAEKDDGGVVPEAILARGFYLLAIVVALGVVFLNSLNDDTTTYPLTQVMRSHPFAFFAAPAWLAIVTLVTLGTGMTVLQKYLMTGSWPHIEMLLGFGMTLCLLVGVASILKEELFTHVFLVMFLLCYTIWVFYFNPNKVTWTIYALSGWAIFGASLCDRISLDVRFILCFLGVAWLCLYAPVVPPGPVVYVTVREIRTVEDATYQSSA